MNKETIYPICTNEGDMGVKLDVFIKPSGCPGLGGWKTKDSVVFWTRVKGQDAKKVWDVARYAADNCIAISLDGDRIISIK